MGPLKIRPQAKSVCPIGLNPRAENKIIWQWYTILKWTLYDMYFDKLGWKRMEEVRWNEL